MGLFGNSAPAPQTYSSPPIVMPSTPTVPPVANTPIVANAPGTNTGPYLKKGMGGPAEAMAGFDGTVGTSPLGAPGPSLATKTLLGG